MDALVWAFQGMRHIETFIAVVDSSVLIATRGPIIDRWSIFHRASGVVEDAHDQAIRDTETAEAEGQRMTLPPTRIALTTPEAASLTDPHTVWVADVLVNDLLRRGMKTHLRSGLVAVGDGEPAVLS